MDKRSAGRNVRMGVGLGVVSLALMAVSFGWAVFYLHVLGFAVGR